MILSYSKLTPYELDKIGHIEAIKYLIEYLKNGDPKEKCLSAEAINKLSNLYKEECRKTKPYLMNNLNDQYPWVRQYTLKVLLKLGVSNNDIDIIKKISKNDDKQYNKHIADEILNKYIVLECDGQAREGAAINEKFSSNKLTLEDILNNKDFMKFLDYCDDIKYKFDGSPEDQNRIITRYREVLASMDLTGVSDEAEKLRRQYSLFRISDGEINLYFNSERELSDELKEEYGLIGDEFADLLNEGINGLRISQRDIRMLRLRYNFYWCKVNTLQTIASEYGISRERVRQVVLKSNRKLANLYRRERNRGLFKLKLLVNNLLRPVESGFEKRLILLLVYGFQSSNTPILIKLITQLIKGNKYESIIQTTFKIFNIKLNEKIEEERKVQNRDKKIIRLFDRKIRCKIKWSEKITILTEKDYIHIQPVREVNFDSDAYVGDFYSMKMNKKIQYESQLEREILLILENSPSVLFYAVQPFKIPYFYLRERNYIPDIFFVLDDGRGVVIEVKPQFHMALDLNMQKYNVLEKFCKEKGYGLLITDGRISLEELKGYEHNRNFEYELLHRLKGGPIKWNELSILSRKHCISHRDIPSIVLKNNLFYNKAPVIIEMRAKINNERVTTPCYDLESTIRSEDFVYY